MGQDSPGCEVKWILGVRFFRWRLMAHGMKSCASARSWEFFGEETRGARVIFRWTGPEDSVTRLDLLVSDACVIRWSGVAGLAEFVEHVGGVVEGEVTLLSEPFRKTTQDLQVCAHAVGRIERATAPNDAAFQIGYGAFLFRP